LQRNIASARSSRSGGIFQAAQGFVATKDFHDLENAGRGEGAGQGGTQRLGDGAELEALLGDEIAQPDFERDGLPVGRADLFGQRAQQRTGLRVNSLAASAAMGIGRGPI